MAITSTGTAVWKGSLVKGEGSTTAASSGAFRALPLSWKARTESHDSRTSPEELLAAAHASCFAMALAHGLAEGGKPPEELQVEARVSFDRTEAGWKILTSALTVRGRVPGVGHAEFQKAVDAAKQGCPVSKALKGNVEVLVVAELAEAVR